MSAAHLTFARRNALLEFLFKTMCAWSVLVIIACPSTGLAESGGGRKAETTAGEEGGAASGAIVRRDVARVKPAYLGSPIAVQRKEFLFGDRRPVRKDMTLERDRNWPGSQSLGDGEAGEDSVSAWINSDGDFFARGWVEHRGLRCATYKLGIRFGIGNPACSQVQWVTETRYLSSHSQCNNAPIQHRGGGNDPKIKAQFAGINCAERAVLCRGNCR